MITFGSMMKTKTIQDTSLNDASSTDILHKMKDSFLQYEGRKWFRNTMGHSWNSSKNFSAIPNLKTVIYFLGGSFGVIYGQINT